MVSESTYEFDVFISYSSYDVEWASKIYDDLKRRNIKAFMDKKRLMPGLNWEPQIVSALRSSRHLLVLWSNKANESPWVRRELGHFDSRIHAPVLDQSREEFSRIIFLLLEQVETAYSSIQMIADLANKETYTGGINSVHPDLWRSVVNKVDDALQADRQTEFISLLVLTTTLDRINQIDSKHKPPFGTDLETMLNLINIGAKDNLAQYYGESALNWRPFCRSIQINDILEKLKQDINQLSNSTHIEWNWIGEKFWSDDLDDVKEEVNKSLSGLCVIIIDPIALYDPYIQARFQLLDPCFKNEKAMIMVLAPFGLPEIYVHYRSLIKQMANRLFEHFYEPPGISAADCHTNVGDEYDIRRLLLTTFRAKVETSKSQAVPRFLRMG